MQKYIVEFIGTFFLVLTIGLVVIEPGAGVLAPVAIGCVLIGMIYAGGHISDAHYNPAVTLAFWMRGRCETKDVFPYMVAQLFAAVDAALIALFFKSGSTISAASLEILPALVAELLFTFALAFVILNVATSKHTAGNTYYGVAIGLTVIGGIFAVGGISGAVFNPAVAVGITIMGLSSIANIWIFLIANFAGGALAAVVFNYLNPDDK